MKRVLAAVLSASLVHTPWLAAMASPTIGVVAEPGIDAKLTKRVETAIAVRRAVRPLADLPAPQPAPSKPASDARREAIMLALRQAQELAGLARFDACAQRAGDQLGDAVDVLSTRGELSLLREVHIQLGACLAMPEPQNARPHFEKAVLLDESPLQLGLHNVPVEQLYEQVRQEVLGRKRGAVRIETVPEGAEVWLDGKKLDGVTPLIADARLGHHFVTVRRFRFEPHTQSTMLQPDSTLRLTLARASRATLDEQLGEVAAGTRKVPEREKYQARAAIAQIEQLVIVSKRAGPATTANLELVDAADGRTLARRAIAMGISDRELKLSACALLGEKCEPDPVVPWYVWVTASAVTVAAASIAVGLYLDKKRDIRFCPSAGC